MSNEIEKAMETLVAKEDGPTPAAEQPKDEMSELKETINSMGQKIENLAETTAKVVLNSAPTFLPAEVPPAETLPELDPDFEKVLNKKIEAKVEAEKNAVLKQQQAINTQRQWDQKAEDDFPWLFKSDHPDFKQEYKDLLKREYNNGISDKASADAVYNACARTQAQINKIRAVQASTTTVRNYEATQMHLQPASSGTSARPSQTLNDHQRYIAAKLGVSEEKYNALHGKTKNMRTH